MSLALSLGFGALAFWHGAAQAQGGQCGDRTDIVTQLHDRYGEARVGAGLTRGQMLELFASATTGSWTLLVSAPDGRSCLVASGNGWTDTAARPTTPGV
ncbi:hypothetical protein GSH16_03550 [Rhodobacteraceae bacterium KN286]|uniref:Lipoprotein n=2 Tax=Oceanomicrobium pacificus TaxID=2692916 RepID=A0A6B0U042_9RHOB|nr:hypothetical protein [Oceanomicrobium pacificus]